MKDAFYFAHDSNAKDDPKIVLLIEQLGLEGYGIFWILIETLRDQPNYKYPLILLPAIARRYNTTHEKVKAVVCNYRLFQIDNEEEFFSVSLMERMKRFEEKREQAKIAADKRWSKQKQLPPPQNSCESNADALPTQSDSNAIKLNDIKLNNNKSNNNKTLVDDFAQIVENFTDNENLKDSIQDFIEHRKSLKKPIKTIRTLELILEELLKYQGAEAKIKVINQSIVNGWQGLFELKESNKKLSDGTKKSSNPFKDLAMREGLI